VLLAALCAADFLVVADGLIVAVALPAMQDALAIASSELQWVLNAYLLCFGGFLLLGGRLGDLFGRRRVLVVGLWLFALGAVVGGLAGSAWLLIAGRALQGVGAALMAPCALALLAASFPSGAQRDRALARWSAVGSLGIPAGALLGGVLTAALSWRWVLLINGPLALAAAAATLWAVPESRDERAARRLDVPGALLVTAGVGALIFGIVRSTDDGALGPGAIIAGLLLLAAFVLTERRSDAPLVPPGTLRAAGRLPAALAGAVLPIGLGAVLFLGTLYLQRVLAFDALETGLAYLALSLPVLAGSPAASRLSARTGRRRAAVLGLLLQAGGLFLLTRADASASFLIDVLPAFVLVGVGAPIAFVPVTASAMADAGRQSGLISGVFNTAQQIGNAVGLAALATLSATHADTLLGQGLTRPDALAGGYHAGFLLGAAFLVAACLPAGRIAR
jgi:EmrB/QacA subfamily drug resistance transporter